MTLTAAVRRWIVSSVLLTGVVAVALAAGCANPRAATARLRGPELGVTPPALAEGRRDGAAAVSPRPDLAGLAFSATRWTTDFTRHSVSLGEIEPGGPGKDGIPALDHPRFVTSAEASAFLAPDEPVMVVRSGGEARAYPLQILLWHEIVNDVIGSEPIVVTYCPLCNSALAFRRTVNGRVLDFGTTGNLRHSDLVMYDRQTESWWQQITGEGIVGEFTGTRLALVPSSIVAYADFRAADGDGHVLSRQTGYARPYGANPYRGYDSGEPFLFSGPADGRLRATERVVAIALNGDAVAYPFTVLERERVVNDEVGGTSTVVLFKPGTRSVLDAASIEQSRDVGAGVAFDRRVDGRTLTFRPHADGAVDMETGSRWDVMGRAVAGSLAGKRLDPVAHGNHFWFAWAVFQPGTRVYGAR